MGPYILRTPHGTQARRPNNIPELHLPRPNEFIPTNLEVEKKEVTLVSHPSYTLAALTASSI